MNWYRVRGWLKLMSRKLVILLKNVKYRAESHTRSKLQLKYFSMNKLEERNPDSDFVLHGKKEAIKTRQDDYLSNSQRTISTKNLQAQRFGKPTLNKSRLKNINAPSIEDLEKSISDLKYELHSLNRSLQENYEKSQIFLGVDLPSDHGESDYKSDTEEDPELRYLLQRKDEEAVSHLPDKHSAWYSDPRHKTKPMGDYPTFQDLGVTKRSVSPVGRGVGRFGSEIATKDVTGNLKPSDLACNERTFPVRLTAPHIVGVRSLLPPKYKVRDQNKDRALSPASRSRSVEPEILLSESMRKMLREGRSRNGSTRNRTRSPSPLPVWMPVSKDPNYSAKTPPPFGKQRGCPKSKQRPGTAPAGGRRELSGKAMLNQSLPITGKPFRPSKYIRPEIQPLPSGIELSFLRSADQIDTRRALVENSPYQQHLARLRLERLRVEEDYLLQLKRESELERIRGPKPKWYEMKGPEFHYECNKNTTLHKNSDHWGATMQYRDDLLEASREFAANMRSPVPALE